MRLNQRQIDIFNAIMTNKSMTAAAGAVGTSQPTISREIRELERRIGFELFLRFGKRLTPTDQAVLLHEVVRRSFVGLDEISRAASAICTRNAGTFRIASIPALAESIVPRVIQRFLKVRPAVHFTIHSHEEPSLRHEMTTQVFDLGLTEDDFERDDATIETIPVADMVCVLPARHRLAARMVLEPEDFAGESFVHFEQNDPYRRKLDQVFVAAEVVRSYAAETTTAASVCAMVGMGVGVSVINPLTAASHAGRNVVFRKLGVSVPYALSVWRPRRSSRTGQSEKVVAAVKEVVAEMRKNLKATLAR